MFELLKGKKLKLLGLAYAALAFVDGYLGIDLLKTVDATNVLDCIMLGLGVFAGRDALDTLIDRLKGEMKAR
jgi:hypothetical protein